MVSETPVEEVEVEPEEEATETEAEETPAEEATETGQVDAARITGSPEFPQAGVDEPTVSEVLSARDSDGSILTSSA